MNLANKLTISRVLAIPFLVFFLSVKEDNASPMIVAISYWLATITIVFATITDYYDGKIARKLGLESSFGKLMDPLADKLIVMAGFIACMSITRPHTSTPLISGWFVIIILAREFFVTGLRQIALEKGIVMGADRLGKHKTGWQLGLLISVCSLLAIRHTTCLFDVPPSFLQLYDILFIWILNINLTVVFILTIWSGISYFYTNRNLIHVD